MAYWVKFYNYIATKPMFTIIFDDLVFAFNWFGYIILTPPFYDSRLDQGIRITFKMVFTDLLSIYRNHKDI